MSHTVLLFPGQGSQQSGMGRDLAEADTEAMRLWKRAEQLSGLALREIFWEGDDAAMSDTRALQPGLTVMHLTLWNAVAGRVRPCGAAGHSLGEYAALAAAQVLAPDTVLELTALRGRIMAEADPHGQGSMAAILKLALPEVEQITAEASQKLQATLLVANHNTPGQFVVSGDKRAVDEACRLAREHRGRALPLKVSGAFHSPMMAEANAELAPLLRKAHWRKPQFPVYMNAHGTPVYDGESAREAMLVQMTSPVRWIDSVRHQFDDGARHWLELGPKAVLGKMVEPCLSGREGADACTVSLVHDAATAAAYQE